MIGSLHGQIFTTLTVQKMKKKLNHKKKMNSTQSQPVESQPVEETTAIVTHDETEVQTPTQINPITDG